MLVHLISFLQVAGQRMPILAACGAGAGVVSSDLLLLLAAVLRVALPDDGTRYGWQTLRPSKKPHCLPIATVERFERTCFG